MCRPVYSCAKCEALAQEQMPALEPGAWLRDVLGRIGEHPINQLDQLLPWNSTQPATHGVA